MRRGLAVFVVVLLVAIRASCEDALRETVEKVAAAIAEDATPVKRLFSEEFLRNVPWDRIAPLLQTLRAQHGKVARVEEAERKNDRSGSFRFVFEKGEAMPVRIGIAGDPPRIVMLWFGAVGVPDDDWGKVRATLSALPGTTSLCVADLDADPKAKTEDVISLRQDEPLAIGSTFKLYVLGALAQEVKAGRLHWEDVVRLRREWKSLPSGFLQQWPVDAPITFHTLASLMISQSDNTATDHVLLSLGRDKVEAMLEPMGNSSPERDRPFLTTAEMFLVKAGPDDSARKKWASADENGRRQLLAGLPHGDLEKCAWDQPRMIDSLEWFASTRDLCAAMGWLRKNADDTARGVLAINRGMAIDWSPWTYVGFKGGSEPGVISMTYLLQRKGGRWFALSMTWNDPQHAVDEGLFVALAGRAVDLLGKSK